MPRGRIGGALLALVMLGAHPVLGSTSFFVRGVAGDFVGEEAIRPIWLDPSTAGINLGWFGTEVRMSAYSSLHLWGMVWYTPPGGLEPGTYEQLSPSDPLVFRVNGGSSGCMPVASRVVVHEVTIEGGQVTSLSLDFEQHCEANTGGGTYGSFRYRAGDTACASADDGTPCDDADACTPVSSCAAGACIADEARPVCLPTAQCFDAGLCDPVDAACAPLPPAPNGTPCDDVDACTTADHCDTGVCTGAVLGCDDQSPCTADACDAATGCTHAPLAEQCWALAGRAVVRGRASGILQGRQVQCAGKCLTSGLQVLLVDGESYRLPAGVVECTDGDSLDVTDEIGVLTAKRRARIVFEPTNLDEVRNDLHQCSGARLKGIRRWMRFGSGGDTLTARERVRTIAPNTLPVHLTITTEMNGAPYDPDDLPEFPPFPNRAPDCGSGLQLRCRVQ